MNRLRGPALAGLLFVGLMGSGCSALRVHNDSAATQYGTGGFGATMMKILLYIPNRVADLAEIVRFGVNIGPGIGIDAEATGAFRAAAMTRASAGLGYQGLRHSPISMGTETYVAVGPFEPDIPLMPDLTKEWYRSKADLRIEPHLVIVGAHGAIDLWAIADFFAGILTIDPEEDDWEW
jgi:hypothetical protein